MYLEYIGTECFFESNIEEVRFPASIRVIGCGAFKNCKRLRRAELNKGLEVLGEKWSDGEQEIEGQAFRGSGIESMSTPSTLRVIEAGTFSECKNLNSVEFANGLEKIGKVAFTDSGVKSITLPPSTKTISGFAFANCKYLHKVQLNEGLAVLGEEEYIGEKVCKGNVFLGTALRSVTIPSTLKVLEENTFSDCESLKNVELQ